MASSTHDSRVLAFKNQLQQVGAGQESAGMGPRRDLSVRVGLSRVVAHLSGGAKENCQTLGCSLSEAKGSWKLYEWGGMDTSFLRDQILKEVRLGGVTPEEAARNLARGYGGLVSFEIFAEPLALIRAEGEANAILDGPSGVRDRYLQDEAKNSAWYVAGGDRVDVCWAGLRHRFEEGRVRDALEDIDCASTKVVAQLANPAFQGVSKRGLVLGYVQSGKTANFTSVMAKAADAGYSLFIVLSGLHNNLRQQTQVRLDSDLMNDDWHPLTTADADFTNSSKGAALVKKGVKSLAVVKKNQSRLRAVRDWLRDIPIEIRRRVPVLLLDDEADQATPNSATALCERSRINLLVRQIWAEIPTGTYLGYTATPFANVFMDPADGEELYPADFIIDLPRPDSYFGAERIFGREPLHDADDPDLGLDMVRTIPDWEAELLKPPGKRVERDDFDPDLPESLREAVRWFVLASAIRRQRGQRTQHSSMLIHTTHFVAPHFTMKARVRRYLDELLRLWSAGDQAEMLATFTVEKGRVAEVGPGTGTNWDDLEDEVERVLEEVRVVVDNGASEDRLDYNRCDLRGQAIPETVIAIGGGTLSRGLTLEGLLVSYFTRTSNTYDTLLQMGRWFGFRPGYEDLPRMWLQPSLAEEFRFLALVEEEIRGDIRDMARRNQTPRQLGVRVRSHPGRLEIVARNKMHHANKVRLSYAGQRLQTFLFEETNEETIRHNLEAAHRFVSEASEGRSIQKRPRGARWQIDDVPTSSVTKFLADYSFHTDHHSLNSADMIGWIERANPGGRWNVVIAGNTKQHKGMDGSPLELGSVDLGVGLPVPTSLRAPLKEPDDGNANIKALLSKADWFADIDPAAIAELDLRITDPRAVRRELAPERGVIILMPISKSSVPFREQAFGSRREMRAPDHLMGVGIIFPDVADGSRASGEYYSVLPDWEPETVEEDEFPVDSEGDFAGTDS